MNAFAVQMDSSALWCRIFRLCTRWLRRFHVLLGCSRCHILLGCRLCVQLFPPCFFLPLLLFLFLEEVVLVERVLTAFALRTASGCITAPTERSSVDRPFMSSSRGVRSLVSYPSRPSLCFLCKRHLFANHVWSAR